MRGQGDYHTRWRVIAEQHFEGILARLRRGEKLAAICASIPGGPSPLHIHELAKRSPGHMSRLRKYVQPRKTYSDEAWSEGLAALASSTERNFSKVRIEGLPSYDAMAKRARRDPDFTIRLNAAIEGRQAQDHFRPTQFSDAAYERALFLISSQPELPIAEIKRSGEWRRLPTYGALFGRADKDRLFAERFAQARALHTLPRFSKDAFAQALAVISERPKDPMLLLLDTSTGLPSLGTLRGKAWRCEEFDERLRAVLQVRRTSRIVSGLESRSAGNFADDLFKRIDRALPRYLDQRDRDEIRSEIIESILMGDLAADEIEKKIKIFVTVHNREFSSRKFASLDQTFGDDNDTAFIDLISADRWSMEGI